MLIYIIAGEASGDVLGARLIRALRQQGLAADFGGIGGPRMQELGFQSLFPMRDLAVMGLMEILPRLRSLRARLIQTKQDIETRRPDLLITIDSPGFTLRVLRHAAQCGIKRAHYVAPQVWAWKEKRVKDFPGLWDQLLCLLPFEPGYFARHGLSAQFVGHPVLESGADQGDATRFRDRHGLKPDAEILMLMPGSRRSEISRLLPVFGQTIALLAKSRPHLQPVMPVSAVIADDVRRATANWPIPPIMPLDLDDKHDAYAAASAALTKSGTSTLELALAEIPMVVTYRVNPITAIIARRMIKTKFVAMVNLLANKLIAPELLQSDCNPQSLHDAIVMLLDDPVAADTQRANFRQVMASLHPGDQLPSEAAASAILGLLQQAG